MAAETVRVGNRIVDKPVWCCMTFFVYGAVRLILLNAATAVVVHSGLLARKDTFLCASLSLSLLCFDVCVDVYI